MSEITDEFDNTPTPDRIGVGPGSGWMTRQEAASYIGLGPRQLDRLVAMGKLAKRQAGRNANVWISKDECDRYLHIPSA